MSHSCSEQFPRRLDRNWRRCGHERRRGAGPRRTSTTAQTSVSESWIKTQIARPHLAPRYLSRKFNKLFHKTKIVTFPIAISPVKCVTFGLLMFHGKNACANRFRVWQVDAYEFKRSVLNHQCDEIGQFLKGFSDEVAQIFRDFLGYFEKCHYSRITAVPFWDYFLKHSATFYQINWSHCPPLWIMCFVHRDSVGALDVAQLVEWSFSMWPNVRIKSCPIFDQNEPLQFH